MEQMRGWKMVWSPRGESGGGDLLDRVLAVRGVVDSRAFLEPSLLDLHEPGLMPGIERACERLLAAARSGEPIVIYGDYDVDGITATAILHRMLRALEPGARVLAYVPHRVEEGYGLSSAALVELADRGARVVVSVDCGITAVEPALAAKEAGLDLIITDHHNPPGDGEPMPEAFEIVHPRMAGSAYPFGELCGAGVAYKIAWRLATMHEGSERVSPEIRTLLLDLLALAALGTVADVVPLVDENRAITRFGLSRCKTTAITGLEALIEAAGLAGESIDAESVGFRLGPMLNASGRMGHAREAVELFTTEERGRADEIARRLCELNEERKKTQRRIFEQAAKMAEAAGMTGDDRRAIVLAHEDWHPGVVGIVCSRLVETFSRPAILMQKQDGGVCAGSGRSIDGFNLHSAVGACSDLLTSFGGHDMAVGIRLDTSRLAGFTERFLERVHGELAAGDLVRTAWYDCVAWLEELTPRVVGGLDRLGPFGRSNPPVRLLIAGVRVDGRPTPFGRRGEHLGVRFREAEGPGLRTGRFGGSVRRTEVPVESVRAIGWGWAEMLEKFRPGEVLDVLVEPKVSDYSGKVEPVLVDARSAGEIHVCVGREDGVAAAGGG